MATGMESFLDTDIDRAKQLGKTAFGHVDQVASAGAQTNSSLTTGFPRHPASPAAAESLRAQQQRATPGVEEMSSASRSMPELLSAIQRADQPHHLLVATSNQQQPTVSAACAQAGLLHVMPVEGGQADMVKNLLRTRDAQGELGAAAGAGSADDLRDSSVSAAGVLTRRGADESHSHDSAEPLNIHQGCLDEHQTAESEQATCGGPMPTNTDSSGAAGSGTFHSAAHQDQDLVHNGGRAVGAMPDDAGAGILGKRAAVPMAHQMSDATAQLPALVHSGSSMATVTTAGSSVTNHSHIAAASSSSSSAANESPVDLKTLDGVKQFVEYFKLRRSQLGYTQAKVGQALQDIHGSMFSQTTVCRFENMQLSLPNALKLQPILEKWMAEAVPLPENKLILKSSKATAATSASVVSPPPSLTAQVVQGSNVAVTMTTDSNNQGLSPSGVRATYTPSSISRPAFAIPAPVSSPSSASESGSSRRKSKGSNNQRTLISSSDRETLEAMYKTYPKPTPAQMENVGKTLNVSKQTVRIWFCNRRQKENRMKAILDREGM